MILCIYIYTVYIYTVFIYIYTVFIYIYILYPKEKKLMIEVNSSYVEYIAGK